jgi:hypothetical protein
MKIMRRVGWMKKLVHFLRTLTAYRWDRRDSQTALAVGFELSVKAGIHNSGVWRGRSEKSRERLLLAQHHRACASKKKNNGDVAQTAGRACSCARMRISFDITASISIAALKLSVWAALRAQKIML